MAWERSAERPILTGNTRGTNWLIGGFATFNLIMSFFAAGWARMRFGLGGPAWDFWLTGFPLTFFGIFLAIPAARAGLRKLGDAGRARRNERRQALKRVFDADGKALPSEPVLEALLLPLEGEPEANDSGQVMLRFPRIAEEREALRKHLAGVDVGAEKRIGKVIFGGADDAADPGELEDGDRDPPDKQLRPASPGAIQKPLKT